MRELSLGITALAISRVKRYELQAKCTGEMTKANDFSQKKIKFVNQNLGIFVDSQDAHLRVNLHEAVVLIQDSYQEESLAQN